MTCDVLISAPAQVILRYGGQDVEKCRDERFWTSDDYIVTPQRKLPMSHSAGTNDTWSAGSKCISDEQCCAQAHRAPLSIRDGDRSRDLSR